MIKYTEELSCEVFALFPDSAPKTKSESLYLAYGGSLTFIDFWVQETEGEVSAILSRFDGVVTVTATENADFEELCVFLPAVTNKVFCDIKTAEKCNLKITEKVFEMTFSGGVAFPALPVSTDCKKTYELLASGTDGDITLPDFESFYADLSHRTKHNTAISVLGEAGVALCPFLTVDAALIGGVATKKESRNKGCGKEALLSLIGHLGQRKVFVTARGDNVKFYEKCGFSVTDNLSYAEIK